MLQVEDGLLDLGATHAAPGLSLRYIQLFVDGGHFDPDQVLNVFRLFQRLHVEVATVFELREDSLSASERSAALLRVELIDRTHLRRGGGRVTHTLHSRLHISI